MGGKSVKCPSCREPFVVEIEQKRSKSKRRRSATTSTEADEFSAAPPPIVMGKKPKTKKREPAVEASDAPAAEPKKSNKVAIISAVSVAVILVWVGVVFLIRNAGGHTAAPEVAVPDVFETARANNSKFSVEHPKEWPVETGGGSGGLPTWLKMKHADITIAIKETPMGGALGDIAQAGSDPNQELPDELAPVAGLHQDLKSATVGALSNYKEQPAITIKTGMGDARLSEFTASEWALGSAIYGYRATLLAGPRHLVVLIKCPKKANWQALKPTFQQIIESIR